MRHALIVFARAPELGLVKTRLAATIGDEEALTIYTELGSLVVEQTASGRWTRTIAFTPDVAEGPARSWLAGTGSSGRAARGANTQERDLSGSPSMAHALRFRPQGSGDLGERMARAIRAEVHEGADRVVVIGTDCPDVDALVIERAFSALDDADVVYGPAADGGYYLVGVAGDHPALFEHITWSDPHVLAVSLERAAAAGLRVHLLEELRDIDREEDLIAWRERER